MRKKLLVVRGTFYICEQTNLKFIEPSWSNDMIHRTKYEIDNRFSRAETKLNRCLLKDGRIAEKHCWLEVRG